MKWIGRFVTHTYSEESHLFTVCPACGAYVGDEALHAEWHRAQAESNVRALDAAGYAHMAAMNAQDEAEGR